MKRRALYTVLTRLFFGALSSASANPPQNFVRRPCDLKQSVES